MSTTLLKIRFPDQSSKTIKLHENSTINDARNAILNRLDKRISRHDFYLYNIINGRSVLLDCSLQAGAYKTDSLMLKRLFIPRVMMQEIKQDPSFLVFELVRQVLKFPQVFSNAPKLCALAFRHYMGENVVYQAAREYFQEMFSEAFFGQIMREMPPCDAQNAEQLILQEISKNSHGFAELFTAGIVQQDDTRVLQRCILAVQEEGIYVLGEKGRQMGGISWFEVKSYGGSGRHFCIETASSQLWFACLEAAEVVELIDGWIARTAARIIM